MNFCEAQSKEKQLQVWSSSRFTTNSKVGVMTRPTLHPLSSQVPCKVVGCAYEDLITFVMCLFSRNRSHWCRSANPIVPWHRPTANDKWPHMATRWKWHANSEMLMLKASEWEAARLGYECTGVCAYSLLHQQGCRSCILRWKSLILRCKMWGFAADLGDSSPKRFVSHLRSKIAATAWVDVANSATWFAKWKHNETV